MLELRNAGIGLAAAHRSPNPPIPQSPTGAAIMSNAPLRVGDVWSESETTIDSLSGRMVRRLTQTGRVNQTPTYHTNSGFSADGRFLAFASVREGPTWVLRANTETGELKALWRAPGVGDRNYIHRGMALTFGDVDGRGICGNRICMAPQRELAVFTCERQLLAVDLHSCEVHCLLDDCGKDWIFGAPCVSPDETQVAITLSSAHPELAKGKQVTRPYLGFADHVLRLIRVPLQGKGAAEVLYEHQPAQSAHCAFCPSNPDLLYFDLDLPPRYWCGSDGQTPRIWLLDLRTRQAAPLKPQFPGPFQTHQAWLWDGSAMAYHGPLPGGGVYLGVTGRDGQTLWERAFPDAMFYGHLTPDAARQALILDGDFSKDMLQWLHYDTSDGMSFELKPICRHGTEWGGLPGQYSHPHPLTDAAGRWVSFTAARAGRSDVFVVDARPADAQ